MDFQWTKKDLLSLYDLSRDEILHILNTAEEFKKVSQRNVKKVPALRGRTVVNLFVEPSTRTRVSFELAEQRLSADIINMNADVSSFRKGETLLDTLKNITFCENTVTLKSALDETSAAKLEELAIEIAKDFGK